MKSQDDIMALIARNLAGIADSIETAQLKEWVGSSDANRKYFDQVKNIWDISDKQIDPEKINAEEAFEKVLARIPIVPVKRTFWSNWQKVAAVAILPLALGTILLVYMNSRKSLSSAEPVYNEVFASFGTHSALRLADSTLVCLNSGSSLRYPDKFNDKTRQVYLKGEAYFEVKSDVSRPFIVHTSNLQVKATGTKFNVLEYSSNPVTEVTLISGKIFVNKSKGRDSQLISELNPNQHLDYNIKTGAKSITNEDTYKYIAWKDGKLIFRNDPLDEVVNKLSQLFNVDIELKGTQLQNYRYRATFHDESLGEILKLLKLSSPIDYKEVKREPLPDGSFPRKKVIIYPVNQISAN
jgi:transmembrane sensor